MVVGPGSENLRMQRQSHQSDPHTIFLTALHAPIMTLYKGCSLGPSRCPRSHTTSFSGSVRGRRTSTEPNVNQYVAYCCRYSVPTWRVQVSHLLIGHRWAPPSDSLASAWDQIERQKPDFTICNDYSPSESLGGKVYS